MAARTEGIEYNPDGTISLTIDGTVRHLRRPKLGEFREAAERLRDLAKAAQAESVRLQELLTDLDENTDDAEIERIEKELEEAQRRRLEYSTPWISAVVGTFSDKPLPENTDDWPAWLAMDVSIPAAILNHWKRVPLPRGGEGKN